MCSYHHLMSGGAVFFFCVCEARERVQIWIRLPADTEDSLRVDVLVTASQRQTCLNFPRPTRWTPPPTV